MILSSSFIKLFYFFRAVAEHFLDFCTVLKCGNFYTQYTIYEDILTTTSSKTADGHNEAEFGMSWCAGFGGDFYNAYFQVFAFFSPYLIGALANLHMKTIIDVLIMIHRLRLLVMGQISFAEIVELPFVGL